MRKLILLLTLPLFLLDLVTKDYIVRHFEEPPVPGSGQYTFSVPLAEYIEHANRNPGDPNYDPNYKAMGVTVIDGYFDIVRVHNTGVAFGMANGSDWANVVFGGITIAALALIWWLWRNNAFPTKVSRVAVALLLSGIFGNLLDRIFRGYVVDFLHFHYRQEWSWPSFNVADSCICIAAGLLFISAFQKAPANPAAEQKA